MRLSKELNNGGAAWIAPQQSQTDYGAGDLHTERLVLFERHRELIGVSITNVLVAALVARGTCSELLEHCVRQHVVVSSQPLLKELGEVLERKFSQRPIDVRAALQLFAETFTLVTRTRSIPQRVETETTT